MIIFIFSQILNGKDKEIKRNQINQSKKFLPECVNRKDINKKIVKKALRLSISSYILLLLMSRACCFYFFEELTRTC